MLDSQLKSQYSASNKELRSEFTKPKYDEKYDSTESELASLVWKELVDIRATLSVLEGSVL